PALRGVPDHPGRGVGGYLEGTVPAAERQGRGRPDRGAGAAHRTAVRGGRGEQGGVQGRGGPAVPRPARRLHRAERLPDPLAQGAQEPDREGLRGRHRGAVLLTARRGPGWWVSPPPGSRRTAE